MQENEISAIIIETCLTIHKLLGPGLFESVYESILFDELIEKGLRVERQKAIPVIWKGRKNELGFRADLVVEGKVIVEIKSVETLAPVHKKQVITYLRLSGLKLGLLINFNSALLKDGISRLVNGL